MSKTSQKLQSAYRDGYDTVKALRYVPRYDWGSWAGASEFRRGVRDALAEVNQLPMRKRNAILHFCLTQWPKQYRKALRAAQPITLEYVADYVVEPWVYDLDEQMMVADLLSEYGIEWELKAVD